MVDLYNTLLKNTEDISFGVNLMSIITSKKQGEVVVKKAKKLLVIYDELEYNPIDCQSIEIKFEGDTIILNVVLAKDNEEHQTENMPQTEAVVPASKTDIFVLQGNDLDAFETLSIFRRKENQEEKADSNTLETHTLESDTFDIQDLTSVQSAILDIVEKEKQFIDKGYKVFEINTPRFDYENSNNFKLIEVVELIQQSAKIVEETE